MSTKSNPRFSPAFNSVHYTTAIVLQKSLQLYRDAYSGHSREVWILTALTLINRMGTMVVPFLSVYLSTVKGFSLEQAGYLMGAFGLGSLGGSFLGGKLSDWIGAKYVMIGSLLIGGCFLISLQWADSFLEFFVMIMATSFFGDAFRPSFMAYIGDFVSKDQTARTMALIRLAINLGMSLSPVVGGLLATSWGYHWLFWIDGSTCVLAALFFIAASWSWPQRQTKAINDASGEAFREAALPPYRNRAYLLFLLSTFLMGFCLIQWFYTVPVFLKTDWGYDESVIGLLMGLSCVVISLVEMPIIHTLEARSQMKLSITLGLICMFCSFIPLLFMGSMWLAVLAILAFTFGEIFYLPFNNAIPSNTRTYTPHDCSHYWH
ncbi:MAG: MFS transporter [Bacteroidota bacterium]